MTRPIKDSGIEWVSEMEAPKTLIYEHVTGKKEATDTVQGMG